MFHSGNLFFAGGMERGLQVKQKGSHYDTGGLYPTLPLLTCSPTKNKKSSFTAFVEGG